MTDLIGTGSTAVAAYQRALGTVSNNIANVGTDGYSRQEVVLQANPAKKEGIVFMGTGVMADRIKRSYDAFAEANLRNSNSDLASQGPMVDYTNRVVDVLGGTTMGLSGAMDQFFASARSVSADPASSVVRGSFIRDAQGLASRFNQLSGQLDLLQGETRDAIENSVGEMNTLVKQLALVNLQMTKNETADSQPPQLLDQRDQLLKELSGFARLTTSFKPNGAVLVSLGPTIMHEVILDGAKTVTIGADFSSSASDKVALVLDPYGAKPSPLTTVTSGKMAGLMAFREQVLGSTRISLDALATMLVHEVNAVHQSGIDGYGNTGAALFTIDPSAAGAAAGMKVVLDDPMMVAAATQFRVIEDANNTGTADATVSYAPEPPQGPPPLDQVLVNNPHPSAGAALTIGTVPKVVASLASGLHDVTVFLDNAKPGQELQLLTRDGRQLLGTSIDKATQDLLMTPANGFADGASYSEAYLNQSGLTGYKNMSVFYGAKADVLQQPVYDAVGQALGSKPLASSLLGGRIATQQFTEIAAGAFTLNGITLAALDPQMANGSVRPLKASDLADWINRQASQTNVRATASNEIRVTAEQFKSNLSTLKINGVTIRTPTVNTDLKFHSLSDLATAIVGQSDETGVAASVSADGELVLSNVPGQEGRDIEISGNSYGNPLGIPGGTYAGRISLTRNNELNIAAESLDLSKPLVLPRVSSTGMPISPTLQLAFTSDSHYTITDLASQRVVAESNYDPRAFTTDKTSLGLGLEIFFGKLPKAGDKFEIDSAITINPPSGGFQNPQALADAINAQSGSTGIEASLSNGSLTLGNSPARGLLDIELLNGPNALGLAKGRYNSVLDKLSGEYPPIKLGFGANGTPADLARLGFRTGAYISGAVKDDLLVFLTGAGTASVAANYSGVPSDPKQLLRGQPMELKFTSDRHYTITDLNTKTVVAERDFDPAQLTDGVSYQGLHMSFSSSPRAGDKFQLDGNVDGTGNNENMLDLAAIESKRVFGGKTLFGGTKTLAMAYIEQVNDIGNIGRQAAIAKASLAVVNEQAVSARDAVSGVSLDEEAADLIRFQQAYQAAAKTIQVASQIFDTILHIQ